MTIKRSNYILWQKKNTESLLLQLLFIVIHNPGITGKSKEKIIEEGYISHTRPTLHTEINLEMLFSFINNIMKTT